MTETHTPQFSYKPSELVQMIDHVTSRRDRHGNAKKILAPFIWGAPGIGKTEIVRSIARRRGSRIVALHLPQFDPTDIKGIPVRMDDDTIRWVPSSYLPQRMVVPVSGTDEISVDFHYATSIAVYLFDEDESEVGRWNDPVLNDMDEVGAGDAQIIRTDQGTWTVRLLKAPDRPCRMEIVDKAIIFLDELSAADPSTQNAALQLVLDRRVGEYDVPYGVPVIAAGNREGDGAFVQALSHPLCNRFVHMTLVPDPDDFIDWAIHNNLRPEIIGMIKWDGDALFQYEPSALVNGQYGFATPRTWEFLSDQYEELPFFMDMIHQGDEDTRRRKAEKLRLNLFAGIVGPGIASKFVGYLQVMHDMPHPDEIVSGQATDLGQVERSQSFGLLYALIYKMKRLYDEHYDPGLAPDKQANAWTKGRDNIFNFITNNFEAESATWAFAVISQSMNIYLPSLRGDAFMKFSAKFSSIYGMVGRKKRAA